MQHPFNDTQYVFQLVLADIRRNDSMRGNRKWFGSMSIFMKMLGITENYKQNGLMNWKGKEEESEKKEKRRIIEEKKKEKRTNWWTFL